MGGIITEKMPEDSRKITSLQATHVIMLTAESGNVSIERADKLNVVGYIPKPFKGEQLLEMASKVLTLQPLAAT